MPRDPKQFEATTTRSTKKNKNKKTRKMTRSVGRHECISSIPGTLTFPWLTNTQVNNICVNQDTEKGHPIYKIPGNPNHYYCHSSSNFILIIPKENNFNFYH